MRVNCKEMDALVSNIVVLFVFLFSAKKKGLTKPQSSSPQTSPVKQESNQVSPGQPTAKQTDKKVRLSTSDGKQCMITLAVDTTFNQLQDLIEKELGIPSKELRIR